jgi:hypothetical protein
MSEKKCQAKVGVTREIQYYTDSLAGFEVYFDIVKEVARIDKLVFKFFNRSSDYIFNCSCFMSLTSPKDNKF